MLVLHIDCYLKLSINRSPERPLGDPFFEAFDLTWLNDLATKM